MQPRLTFTTLVDPVTGYGQLAIALARGLAKHAHVSLRPIRTWEPWGMRIPADVRGMFVSGPQPEPWELMMHPPDFAPTPGKQVAWLTMWEATRLPPMGVAMLNRARLIIVPSEWQASCFSANGVDSPVAVMPLGINTDLFYFRNEPESIKDVCIFGAAGRMAHGGKRKGLEEIVELFMDAFPDERDVRLKLKCFPDCPIRKPFDKRVELMQASLTEEDMASWFEHIHCFVSASRSEGWGLMQHEALAIGRPLISVSFAGVREFFRPEFGYVVPHRLQPGEHGYEKCGHWAEPDRDAMIAAMRHVYANKREAMFRGATASVKVSEFTYDRMTARLVDILKESTDMLGTEAISRTAKYSNVY